MAQYIRFTKTTKKDVTVGKFYEVKNLDTGNGYYFDDDAGEQRYVRRRGKLNYFEVFNEADFPVNDMSEDEVDDVLTAIERLQEQGQSFDMDDDDEEVQYIVFRETACGDITVGKAYEVKWRTASNGGFTYHFDDDAGDAYYVSEGNVRCNEDFEVMVGFDSIGEAEGCSGLTEPSEYQDGVVCIDFIDGYVAHFHDVDSFDIEERVGITLVIITDVEGGKTLIPFDRVRKMRLLHLHDGADE